MTRCSLFVLIIVMLLVGCERSEAPPASVESSAIALPGLRDEILQMTRNDQAVQQEILANMQPGQPMRPEDVARQDSVFASHMVRARSILETHGWPGVDQVGAEASEGMFLIIQHADSDLSLQRMGLALLEEAVQKKQASALNLAYLTDRVRQADGRPQVYGTQLAYDDRACPIAGDIEAVERVDARRAEVGLEPLADYLAQVAVLMGRGDLCTSK